MLISLLMVQAAWLNSFSAVIHAVIAPFILHYALSQSFPVHAFVRKKRVLLAGTRTQRTEASGTKTNQLNKQSEQTSKNETLAERERRERMEKKSISNICFCIKGIFITQQLLSIYILSFSLNLFSQVMQKKQQHQQAFSWIRWNNSPPSCV